MADASSLSPEIRKSLSVSWKEGIPASVMLGILDNYLVPYALFLGAMPFQIGLLVSVPHLLASIGLLWAMHVVRSAGSRHRFLVQGTAFQAALLVPAAFLAFFPGTAGIYSLVVIIIAFRVIGNFIGAAWGSLMSDYLPPEMRGHYMGWRSQVIGIAAVAGVAFAGPLLFITKKIDPPLGFFLLFLAAALCRFLSFWYMRQMADVPHHGARMHDFTFLMFLRRFRESNFVKYVLYVSSITFATQLAAPYFSVYILRDLKFSYLTFTALLLGSVLSGLIAFPMWGKHADVVGNARILKTTSLLIPVIPVFWLFLRNPAILLFVEMLSGFVWCGFNLCATNYIFDAVSAPKRLRCLAYFNLFNGAAIFLGAGLGGILAERLPPLFGHRLLMLFLLSAVLRFAAHFFLSPSFKEVRASAKPVSSSELFFSVLGFRPLAGLNTEWNVFPSKKQIS